MRIRSPYLLKPLAILFTIVIRALFCTLRLDFSETVSGTSPYRPTEGEGFFYCVWHDSMVIPAFAGRHHRAAALTSRHVDGTFVAYVVQAVGMTTIRGSTNHVNVPTMRKLMDATRDGHIVITPDGPRGPRRKVSPGIAFLASHTGRLVVPTAYSCTRSWSVPGSWTDLIIPKPFSRVFLLAGQPIQVPQALSRDQLGQYVSQIQNEMDRIQAVVDQRASLGRAKNSPGERFAG